MNENDLSVIQEKYKNCNLLLPVTNQARMNPFYTYTVMEVQADLGETSGDVFKVGRVQVGSETKVNQKTGEEYESAIYRDAFSPSKPLLMKLANAAGIQFDPINTSGMYINENIYKAKAVGSIMMPDGFRKVHVDEKVINLNDEEKNYLMEFEEKAKLGITDKRQSKDAEKLFKGKWIDAKDKYNNACKAYLIDEGERRKYIERSVHVNMTLLRKTASEKAMTGAILRVIRALIGMKGQYTREELAKPFVIPRVTFSPDFNDPTVRAAMLRQAMGGVSNLYGQAQPAMIGAMDQPFAMASQGFEDVEPVSPAFRADSEIMFEDDQAADDLFTDLQLEDGSKEGLPRCTECGVKITQKVYDFSLKKLGRPLCYECQQMEG